MKEYGLPKLTIRVIDDCFRGIEQPLSHIAISRSQLTN
jgi:hypothetical protein